VSAPAGLTFPTDYPLKVVGRPGAGFRERIDAIVLQHAPTLTPDRVSERPSANGNFLSITYLLRAESRAQVEALVAQLTACEGVLMLL
jgi:putative lipoic acid-binding regulatory protein